MMIVKWHNNPVVFSDTPPTPGDFNHGPWAGEDLMWYNTSNHRWYEYAGGQWVMQGDEPVEYAPVSHSHPTHGDINFTGTISVDGEAGLTGSRVIDGHTLTFKNGILVGYEAP